MKYGPGKMKVCCTKCRCVLKEDDSTIIDFETYVAEKKIVIGFYWLCEKCTNEEYHEKR